MTHLLTVLESIRKKHFIAKDQVILGGEACGTFADNFVHSFIGHGYTVYSVNAPRAKLHRENTKASTDSLDLLGIVGVLLHRHRKQDSRPRRSAFSRLFVRRKERDSFLP